MNASSPKSRISHLFSDDALGAMPSVVLASSSPRRRELLDHAGVEHRVHPASIDDGELVPGKDTKADEWVAALAYLKAISSARTFVSEEGTQTIILGADTVCVHGGEIIGQPEDREHARAMIQHMRSATHDVLTGVAILDAETDRRDIFVDRSVVTVGEISDAQIEEYLDSGLWQGKAGAYNITERLAAGWPIVFEGDEYSIVGLPLVRVIDRIRSFYVD